MKQIILFFLLIFSVEVFSQNDELHFLKGKIICQNVDLTTIVIQNQRSESVVNPENNGDFSIFVKLGDKLIFQGLAVDTKMVEILKEELTKKLLTITLYAKVIPLEDVEVKTYPNINAVSLGILDKPAKKYSPAERRLRTAETFKWYSPLLIPIGGMSVDGLINSISGRTAMLKKELEIERQELTIKKIEDNYEENYFIDKLKIPNDYVQAFIYYISDSEELRNVLKTKDKTQIDFVFAKLASEYLTLLKEKSE